MDHFGGLDVSVKETSICIVDDTGRIVITSISLFGPELVCCEKLSTSGGA